MTVVNTGIEEIGEVSFIEDSFFLLCTLRLRGKRADGRYVYPAVPVSLDVETGIMKTYSGSVYRIISYDGDKALIVSEIMDTIKRQKYRLV